MSTIPKFLQNTTKAARQWTAVASRCHPKIRCREYWGRPSRHLPVWCKRSMFDDFFDHSWRARKMENPFKLMEKMMGEFGPPRWFVEPYAYARTAAKEVEVKYNDKMFEVRIDVSHFNPEELNVKLAGERLTVTGRHQEKPDEHGFISREFTREVMVPENVDLESLESLHNDGQLIVRGKVKGAEDIPERTINIQKDQPSKPSDKE